MPGAIAVLTRESVPEVLEAGGTGNWVTNMDRARGFPYVVLVRNGRHPASPSDTDHGTAFLVGRVSGARTSAETAASGYPRIFIEISQYALIAVPDAWSKSQNPVWYTDLKELGINENELQFQPVPQAAATPETPAFVDKDEAVAEAKRTLGRLFNVPATAVDISIRL
jgi:hypothetical protein